ncbi:hypothetical protein TRAPUB_4167 [Trametes pubescens]|uniref:BTB domain-containing protein n=1 Tax=Trametes pubescens TaxID=154538 RepID=A0A1M2VBX4_TRAPU|nr:hypothetical protein TRAPUB_4167 [Trametes pubescens]
MSLVFTPHFQVDGLFPDVVLLSADNVTFHAHRQHLLAASTNFFGGALASQALHPIVLPETSVVLNIVLHLIYGMSVLRFQPPFEAADAALAALIGAYGVPAARLARSAPLFQLATSYAPYRPIDAYALAAHHGLEDIAVAVSAHLLAYDVSRVTDELSIKMGSVYFSRLYNLQQARLAALKNIVLRPPAAHPPTPACNGDVQRELSRAWAFAAAQIVWTALPSTSIGALQSAFAQAGADIVCPDCQIMLQSRVAEVTREWAAVKVA